LPLTRNWKDPERGGSNSIGKRWLGEGVPTLWGTRIIYRERERFYKDHDRSLAIGKMFKPSRIKTSRERESSGGETSGKGYNCELLS